MQSICVLMSTGPHSRADMEVSITGCRVGKMHEVAWCHVKNLDGPVALHVDFEVKVSSIMANAVRVLDCKFFASYEKFE